MDGTQRRASHQWSGLSRARGGTRRWAWGIRSQISGFSLLLGELEVERVRARLAPVLGLGFEFRVDGDGAEQRPHGADRAAQVVIWVRSKKESAEHLPRERARRTVERTVVGVRLETPPRALDGHALRPASRVALAKEEEERKDSAEEGCECAQSDADDRPSAQPPMRSRRFMHRGTTRRC